LSGAGAGLEAAFAAVLESSRLRGVLGVHVYDAAGRLFDALPVRPGEGATPVWWQGVPAEPRARFRGEAALEMALGLAGDAVDVTRVPLMDVVVPLVEANGAPLGVARYWVDGDPAAREFRRMDRRLAVQAGVAFCGAALLVSWVLAWAFSRVDEANRRLLAQSDDLARANAELDFAAKTNALGAISAHLIHGLRNPLAGLEGFVAETAAGPEALSGEACRAAMETTRRLRALVAEVSEVLRDEREEAAAHAVPADEIVGAARIQAAAAAGAADVRLESGAEPGAAVESRAARLAGLVLANLLANAIEASRARSTVTLTAQPSGDRVEFSVRDEGPGLPAAVQAELFRPVRSSKRGGGGVGLAISHRLARHAGGELVLAASGEGGTEFRLTLPAWRATVNGSSTVRS
jgi:signal transduction histidine kinase